MPLDTAWSWTSTTSWAEVATILTAVVAVGFVVFQWVIPYVSRRAMQLGGSWPVKAKVTAAWIEGERLNVSYEIRPRSYTVTERHSPRVYIVRVVVKTSSGEPYSEDIKFFGSDVERLDQIFEEDWSREWTEGYSLQHGSPLTVAVEVRAGYRHHRRVTIRSSDIAVAQAPPRMLHGSLLEG